MILTLSRSKPSTFSRTSPFRALRFGHSDYWFRFLPYTLVDYYAVGCNVHEDSFFAFLVIMSCVFFVGIFLSLLAFVFQNQTYARLHLVLVCVTWVPSPSCFSLSSPD